jgi:hypothetical protein
MDQGEIYSQGMGAAFGKSVWSPKTELAILSVEALQSAQRMRMP